MKTKNDTKLAAFVALIATALCTLTAGMVLCVMTASAEAAPITDNFALAWFTAVDDSIKLNREVEFKLGNNWEANGTTYRFDDNNADYGEAFTAKGRIFVPVEANVKIDLNGYDIDGKTGPDSVITVDGTLTLVNSSNEKDSETGYAKGTITGGNTTRSGGGVYVNNGTFVMKGGSISGNTANLGGGVYLTGENASLEMNDGNISGNTADYGGGVYVAVSETTSGIVGWGNFTMTGGVIGGDDEKSGNKSNFNGGGVYVAGKNSSFIMQGGKISKNNATKDGGGIAVAEKGSVTMQKGTISENKAVQGGGVGVESSTFSMSDGCVISDNEAFTAGGVGVTSVASVGKTGSFIMTGGTVCGNRAATVSGVGVADAVFTMSGGSIENNTYDASLATETSIYPSCGALIYDAIFAVSGNAKISGNTVDGNAVNLLMYAGNFSVAQMTVTDNLEGAEIWVGGNPGDVLTVNYDDNNKSLTPLRVFHSDKGKLILLNADSKEAYISNLTGLDTPALSENSFVYDGTPKTVSVIADDAEFLTVTGSLEGTNAGNYTVTVSIKNKDEYAWLDGTSADVGFAWRISRAAAASGDLTLPVLDRSDEDQKFEFKYSNLTVVLPEGWTIKDGVITVPGGTKAGNYTLTVTPSDNYCWTDGSFASKELTLTVKDVLSKEMLAFIIVGCIAIALFTAGTTVNIILIRKEKKEREEEAVTEGGASDGEPDGA